MAAQPPTSRLTALATLSFFLGVILIASWFIYNALSDVYTTPDKPQPTPTPTPAPGTYNIDEQLDMLN